MKVTAVVPVSLRNVKRVLDALDVDVYFVSTDPTLHVGEYHHNTCDYDIIVSYLDERQSVTLTTRAGFSPREVVIPATVSIRELIALITSLLVIIIIIIIIITITREVSTRAS